MFRVRRDGQNVVARHHGITMSFASINNYQEARFTSNEGMGVNRIHILTWHDGDYDVWKGTASVPAALRLMADFLDAEDASAAVTVLRNAGRRRYVYTEAL